MAKTQGRNYSRLTIKKLYALSGNQCSFPECDVMFLNSDDDTNYSNICHIEDANQDSHKADRFNPSLSLKNRAEYENLILLCPNHHITTNDVNIFDVNSLKMMKRDHEIIIRKRIAGKNLISKYPSALNDIISLIGQNLVSDAKEDEIIMAPNPELKISFNNIVEYKPIIDTYKVYQGKLSKIYQEIEKQGSTRKEYILKNINTLYLREKGKYVDLAHIQANADDILRNVEKALWDLIENSSNRDKQMPFEAIQMGILIVMVDAFMRCEILEEPTRNDS
jgi:hypothetical protein